MAGKDPLEKLTEHINGILDEREKRAAERADPKARGAKLLDRLEAFLDEQDAARAEAAAKRTRTPAKSEDGDGDGGNIFSVLGLG